MRATPLVAALALAAGILGAGATVVPAFAQNSVTAAQPGAQWMSIEEVIRTVQAAGYRDVEEVERDDGRYEVKASDAEGRRVELKLDPVSGEILKTEVKRSK